MITQAKGGHKLLCIVRNKIFCNIIYIELYTSYSRDKEITGSFLHNNLFKVMSDF